MDQPGAPSHILSGVTVDGVAVGGSTLSEARGKLEKVALQRTAQTVTFVNGDHRFPVSWGELGLVCDVEATLRQAATVGQERDLLRRAGSRVTLLLTGKDLRLRSSLDVTRTRKWLCTLAEKVDVEPQDARADWTDGGIHLTNDKTGRKLSVETLLRSLRTISLHGSRPTQIPLPMRDAAPAVVRADLASLDTLLSQYETSFDPGKRNRTLNMRLAAQAADRQLVRPDHVFSYNRCVGPRLEEFGYLPAPIFSDAEVVQGVGGGVCQVATTIYNAALVAGLDIVARTHHSQPVSYAPPGRDATVYFGNTDLKFRNDTSLPIYFRVYIHGRRVVCAVYGNRSQEREVTLRCTRNSVIPMEEVRVEDATLPAGQEVVDEGEEGRPGCQVTFVREIKKSASRTIRETISNDYYRPKPKRIRVGTGETPPDEGKATGGQKAEVPATPDANGAQTLQPRRESPEARPPRSNPSLPPAVRVEDLGKHSENR
jgi:vancomycin resistance protein YoaR